MKDAEKWPKHQVAMACNFSVKTPRHNYTPDHDNKENPKLLYYTCIGNLYDAYWASMINFNSKWADGIMPFDGGYMNLPSKFVEVMNLVDNLIRENHKDQENKLRQASKNGRGSKR